MTGGRPTGFVLVKAPKFLQDRHRGQHLAVCTEIEDQPFVSKYKFRGERFSGQLVVKRYSVWPISSQLKQVISSREFFGAEVEVGTILDGSGAAGDA